MKSPQYQYILIYNSSIHTTLITLLLSTAKKNETSRILQVLPSALPYRLEELLIEQLTTTLA